MCDLRPDKSVLGKLNANARSKSYELFTVISVKPFTNILVIFSFKLNFVGVRSLSFFWFVVVAKHSEKTLISVTEAKLAYYVISARIVNDVCSEK